MRLSVHHFVFILLCGILISAPQLLSGQKDSASKSRTVSSVDISFDYQHQSGIASNQFAVWIEDSTGRHVQTVYVTRFTATGGWKKRPACLPAWVAVIRPDTLSSQEVDGITGATPTDGRLRYAWDGKDHRGFPAPPGNYQFVVEANLRWDNRVVYRGWIDVGGPAQMVRPDPVFFGEAEKERGMIRNVVVRYVP